MRSGLEASHRKAVATKVCGATSVRLLKPRRVALRELYVRSRLAKKCQCSLRVHRASTLALVFAMPCALCSFKITLVLCVCSITRSGPDIFVSPFHTVFSLHCRTTAEAMDKYRRSSAPWAGHGGKREDHKRTRDEFDDVAQDIVAKMERELSVRLKDDTDRLRRERNKHQAENDRLHAENGKLRTENAKLLAENDTMRAESDRLRAESDRKSAALSQLEEQSTKRFKMALEDAVEEVLGAPFSDGAGTDPSEDDGAAPTLPEAANAAENGPGNAAPSPKREEEEEKAQEQALERAVDSRSETPPALGGH